MLVQFYDQSWQPVSDLVEATARSVTKIRANHACSFSFAMPRNSVKAADLDIAANVLLMGRIPGRITSRRVDGGLVEIEGLSAEDLLNGFKTPRRWVRWNNLDLADVARDLLKPFRWVRWSTQADWQGAVAGTNVDLSTEPGSVLLATEPYLNAKRYVASGSITLRVQLPEDALPTGRVVRWTERVGTATRIKVQTRAADSQEELHAAPWGPELEVVHAEEIEENEDRGVPCADGGRWIDIRLNLYTDDQYSADNDTNPSIFGFSPILDAVELIYRVPGPIVEGSIPASTGVTVTDYEASRITHLRCLVELCERYGHTFRIRLDGGQLVLDLARTFGQNRSADVRLIAGENCVIERLSDSDQDSVGGGKRVSVLHCWGAGEGVDQLYYRAIDPDLVAKIGWVEDDWEDTSITDLATLQARGEEELAKRKQVREEAEVTTVLEVLEGAWLQDTVTLIEPNSGAVKALPIEEIRVEENPDTGELVRLGLGTQLVDLVDEIIRGRALPTGIRTPERPAGNPSKPAAPPVAPPPTNVRPFSVFRGVGARQDVPTGFPWAATEFHVSPVQGFTPDASTRVETARKTEFEAKNLTPGSRYYMRLRNIDEAGNVSEWSPEVSAVAGYHHIHDSDAIRNVLSYTYADSLDANHKLDCVFYMPPETLAIRSAKVYVKGQPYRAYSLQAEYWDAFGTPTTSVGVPHSHGISTTTGTTSSSGRHSHTYSRVTGMQSAGDHKHSLQYATGRTAGVYEWGVEVANHTHQYSVADDMWSAGSHTHTLNTQSTATSADGDHTHTYERVTGIQPASEVETRHFHQVDLSHYHPIVYGIFEEQTPTNVTVEVSDDDGATWKTVRTGLNDPVEATIDITDYLSTTEGYKHIRFSSSRRGRLAVMVLLDLHIDNV